MISPVEVSTVYLEGAYATCRPSAMPKFTANPWPTVESSQTGYRQLALDYYRGNLLIPSNLTFSNFSANQGLSPTTGPNANARVGVRAFIGYGNDTSEQTVDFAKSLAWHPLRLRDPGVALRRLCELYALAFGILIRSTSKFMCRNKSCTHYPLNWASLDISFSSFPSL